LFIKLKEHTFFADMLLKFLKVFDDKVFRKAYEKEKEKFFSFIDENERTTVFRRDVFKKRYRSVYKIKPSSAVI